MNYRVEISLSFTRYVYECERVEDAMSFLRNVCSSGPEVTSMYVYFKGDLALSYGEPASAASRGSAAEVV